MGQAKPSTSRGQVGGSCRGCWACRMSGCPHATRAATRGAAACLPQLRAFTITTLRTSPSAISPATSPPLPTRPSPRPTFLPFLTTPPAGSNTRDSLTTPYHSSSLFTHSSPLFTHSSPTPHHCSLTPYHSSLAPYHSSPTPYNSSPTPYNSLPLLTTPHHSITLLKDRLLGARLRDPRLAVRRGHRRRG